MHLFSQFSVFGRENVPKPPFLATMNHLAYWDVPVLGSAIPYPMPAFAAQKYQHQWWGFLFYMGIPIWVEQATPDRRALTTALKILEMGHIFGLAPEGTRSRTGGLIKGREGAAFLASHAGVPILPIGITGTHLMFRQVRPRVTVTVGKPYRLPDERARGERLSEYTDRIMCAIAALLPESYHGVYAGHPLIAEMAAIVAS